MGVNGGNGNPEMRVADGAGWTFCAEDTMITGRQMMTKCNI